MYMVSENKRNEQTMTKSLGSLSRLSLYFKWQSLSLDYGCECLFNFKTSSGLKANKMQFKTRFSVFTNKDKWSSLDTLY